MAVDLTENTRAIKDSRLISPQLVLEIDGAGVFYSLGEVRAIPRYGDSGFTYGGGTSYGVQRAKDDVQDIISFSGGTSTEIRQVLNIDKGTNSSTSNIRVSLLDKDFFATKLISPGAVVPDILGRRCRLWVGFPDLRFKEDYIVVFRGQIEGVEAKSGVVLLNISSSDSKKRATIFQKGNTELNSTGGINDSVTTIPVLNTNSFLAPYIGASGVLDDSLKFYIRIEDEIIRYEGNTATSFTSCTRGALGTTATSHDDEAEVESFYTLEGNAIDLALKLMASGINGPYLENEEIESIVNHEFTSQTDTLFFRSTKIVFEDNVQVGDFITITDASESGNNVTNSEITAIQEVFDGLLVTIDDSLTAEPTTSAKASFRSQFDVFEKGAGFEMINEEIDIDEHLRIKNRFLSADEYLFYLKDEIKSGLDFLSEQIYNPVSAFSIPRKARASLGLHVGPIPGQGIKTINASNCINPSDLSIERGLTKDFYNAVVYKFDQSVLEDRFRSGVVNTEAESISRIPVGARPLFIESEGMRSSLGAVGMAGIAASRRLSKYKFGAESIRRMVVNFSLGFDLEIGDKVVIDMASLKLSDRFTQSRSGGFRLFEVVNRLFNLKTGRITLDLVDTDFDLNNRFALIGPSSAINGTIVEPNQIRLKSNPYLPNLFNFLGTSFPSLGSPDQWEKWIGLEGSLVDVRTFTGDLVKRGSLISVSSSNVLTVSGIDVGFIGNHLISLAGDYDNQTNNATSIYAYMSDGDNDFDDDTKPYQIS